MPTMQRTNLVLLKNLAKCISELLKQATIQKVFYGEILWETEKPQMSPTASVRTSTPPPPSSSGTTPMLTGIPAATRPTAAPAIAWVAATPCQACAVPPASKGQNSQQPQPTSKCQNCSGKDLCTVTCTVKNAKIIFIIQTQPVTY